MADTTGQADIRGLDINKLATGFAEENPMPMRGFFRAATTSARELRWWKKTAGFIDSTDTSGITASQIGYQSELSRPVVIRQTMTRQTSYIKIFKAESETISEEDIKGSDPDIFGAHVRDIVRAVQRQTEQRMYDVVGEATTSGTPSPTNVPTAAATADGWNDVATGDPIADINAGIESIRSYSYDGDITIFMNQAEEKHLKNFLISVKGSSIPGYSSEQLKSGKIMNLLGCSTSVSPLYTTDYVLMATKEMAVWKSFSGIRAFQIKDDGIGTKIRVKESGEGLLENPEAGYWITDTIV